MEKKRKVYAGMGVLWEAVDKPMAPRRGLVRVGRGGGERGGRGGGRQSCNAQSASCSTWFTHHVLEA